METTTSEEAMDEYTIVVHIRTPDGIVYSSMPRIVDEYELNEFTAFLHNPKLASLSLPITDSTNVFFHRRLIQTSVITLHSVPVEK